MDNKDETIQQFMELTAADNDIAIFYLESSKWDIEAAIASYYGNDADESEEHENVDMDPNVNEELLRNTESNNVHVSVNSYIPKPSKPKEKIATFSSLKHAESDDENEEKGQAFYVGGSERGGGQQVLGPPKVNKKAQNTARIQDLFKSAQSHGAEVVTDDLHESTSSRPRQAFTGCGYRLGNEISNEETVTSHAGSSEVNKESNQPIKVTVKIWSNGFSVDDGQLRTLNEPNNSAFLRSLSTGQIPTELLQQYKYGKIDLNMEDRSSEEYIAPLKPKVIPFQGTGQMLGSPVPNIIISQPIKINQPTGSAVSPIEVDETRPVTQLQIRLADNSRLVVRMNHDHTVGDIRKHIISQRPQYQNVNFNLMVTFPNTILSDDSITLQAANLLNAVVVQRLT